jgi:predicted MFS family arabinose efflux permease
MKSSYLLYYLAKQRITEANGQAQADRLVTIAYTLRHGHLNRTSYSLLAVNLVLSLARFMAFPFLAIYLSNTKGLDAAQIGFILGLGPLASMVFSVVGGYLADRFGSRRLFVISLGAVAASLLGYAHASNFLMFCFFSIVSGISWSVVNITQRTLLAQATSKIALERAFAYNYLTLNMGGAIGPLIGMRFGAGISEAPFHIFIGLLIILVLLIPRLLPRDSRADLTISFIDMSNILRIVRSPVLCWLLVMSFFMFATEAQFETSIAQYLGHYPQGIKLFSQLLVVGTVCVICMQPIAVKLLNFSHKTTFIIGAFLYGIAPITILVVADQSAWYLFRIIMAIGEVLLVPSIQASLARASKSGAEATTFALFGMTGNAAYFFGTWLGGIVFNALGIVVLLWGMTGCGVLIWISASGVYRNTFAQKD